MDGKWEGKEGQNTAGFAPKIIPVQPEAVRGAVQLAHLPAHV